MARRGAWSAALGAAVTGAASAAAALLVASPAAAVPGPVVNPVSVPVTVSSGYRATLTLRCPATVRACVGTLGAVTARPIAPYGSSVPPVRVPVTLKPFSMAGGGTLDLRFRVRGDALAELVRSGRLLIGVRIVSSDGVSAQDVTRQRVLLRLQIT